jgi:endoglucanase
MAISKHLLRIGVYLGVFSVGVIGLLLFIMHKPIHFGSYDPQEVFSKTQYNEIHHVFIAWTPENSQKLTQAIQQANQSQQSLLVTLEPWPYPYSESSKQTLFEDIASGKYDQIIKNFCEPLKDLKKESYLRWGHEMEGSGQYPWQQDSPEKYKQAFVYIASHCKTYTPLTRVVWSPVGNDNLAKFYPGDQFVDIIGLSVFGFPAWEQKHYNTHYSFTNIFNSKYQRVAGYKKPIMIAELGVTGSDMYKQEWLQQAKISFANYPELEYVLYFNDINPGNTWGEEFGAPDWRISQDLAKKLFLK